MVVRVMISDPSMSSHHFRSSAEHSSVFSIVSLVLALSLWTSPLPNELCLQSNWQQSTAAEGIHAMACSPPLTPTGRNDWKIIKQIKSSKVLLFFFLFLPTHHHHHLHGSRVETWLGYSPYVCTQIFRSTFNWGMPRMRCWGIHCSWMDNNTNFMFVEDSSLRSNGWTCYVAYCLRWPLAHTFFSSKLMRCQIDIVNNNKQHRIEFSSVIFSVFFSFIKINFLWHH